MRKFMLLFCVVLLASSVAAAQGKVDSSWNCKPGMTHSLDAGDMSGHAYMIGQAKCTATKGTIDGVAEKEGLDTNFSEVTGNTSKGHGFFLETMANGDKLHVKYDSEVTTSNGKFQSGTDKWWVVDGTGKFKGGKGSGTCSGKGNPDGSVTWTCNGTYSAPKGAAKAPAKK